MVQADEETALVDKKGQSAADERTRSQVYFLVGWALFAMAWITGGVMAGMAFEGWSYLTSLYVIVQIVTTIGYGDVTVNTEAAKLFMAIYVLITLLLIASFVTDFLAKLVCANENFLRQRMRMVEARMSSNIADEAAAAAHYGQHNALIAAFALFFFYTAIGTLFFWWFEDCSCSYGVSRIDGCEEHLCSSTGGATKSLIDAFYMSVITLTTVGFGDHTPRSWWGRLFGCFWMLFGVVATGNMLSKFSSFLTFTEKETKRMNTVSRDVFARIDANADGTLSLMEFRSFALLKFGLISEADLDEVDRMFKAIDKDGSGHLTYEEIESHCDK